MDLSKIATIKYKEKINPSCLNMQHLCGVDFFVVYLLFKNGETFILSNIYNHLNDYYEHQYFLHDHSTSNNLFSKGFYVCDHHKGITEEYNTILTNKHNIHRAYYQKFSTNEFDMVLGAANKLPEKNLKPFYKKTHEDFNNFVGKLIHNHKAIFLSHNPELKKSTYFKNENIKHVFSQKNKPILTSRETTCLQLTAEGMISEEIASILGISKYTVDQYKKNILHKLYATNMPNAVFIAMNTGLLSKDKDYLQKNIQSFRNIICK